MKPTFAILTLILSLLGTACSSSEPAPPITVATSTTFVATPSTSATTPQAAAAPQSTDSASAAVSPLAELVAPIGSATYNPAEHVDDYPDPTSISISRIDVGNAPVTGVGVEANGDMELPGADAVGWYRFNPKPGQEGSSVLAAHISYDGRNGVFRYLSEVEPGDIVTIGYNDGSEATFEIVEVAQYDKQELPLDRVFAKDGAPVLTLITCGGDFNRSLSSYEDNFVAYAVPIEA